MSFRTRFALYILAVHAVIIYLTFRLLQDNKVLFIAAEVLVLVSTVIAIQLYREFRRPSDFIASGIEAIKDKDFTIKFVSTGNPEIDQLIDVYNLMIDQLRTERTKQMEQQFFLEKLIDAAPIAILIFDFDDRIATINPRASRLLQLSLEQLEQRTLADVDHPILSSLIDLEDGEARTIKTNGIETYKIQKSFLMDRGFRRSFLMIEELTGEILDTEKKAYGKVIRMMAHEVNNSIGAVNSILDVTQSTMDRPEENDLRHALRVAIERNNRLNYFMRRFADVVRLPQPHKQPADLNELARDVTQLMQPQAEARGVTLACLPFQAPVVRAIDTGQFEQVLVNVIKNAIEASRAGQAVEVVVNEHLLTVRDNGTPIPDEIAANLFNPFFSTKPDGQGIGLTLTRDILMNHGFTFSLKTNAEGWTEFVIIHHPG
ncbi:PAS/PAC sensor signal transduction histidine kinase [Fibrisoma limi BUZ 3]|uniref:histidine kinase n=1 Tax=Fibrisoma limi BUZ 3 TaxID=1185876 RepID=I2GJ97_9BACT|nr:ATP-binding protein [Fibrisoma limi]CCH53972.1 PAS/PAC sensor signal transduction histidine kinase [Fibrisoma limi BUZ 3]